MFLNFFVVFQVMQKKCKINQKLKKKEQLNTLACSIVHVHTFFVFFS